MPQNNPASLSSAITAAGNLSCLLIGLDTKASWAELLQASILTDRFSDLRGQSVLLATSDQFRASAALIELDGIARRIVLYPPDLSQEHLPYVAKTAKADVLVTDRPEIASPQPALMDHGIGRVIQCGKSISPAALHRGSPIETEWILLTSGTTGHPKLAVHTLGSLADSAWHRDSSSPSTVWSTFYDMRRYGGLHIFLHAALTGTSMILSSAQEPTADFLARAGANGVTHISGTPSHWRRALMSPFADRIAPEYIRLSGEIVDQAILNQVQAQYPHASVAHTFASTEAGVGFYVNDGLMGFPPELLTSNPKVDMKIADGTLKIRSTRAANGYLGTENRFPKDAEGFVDTGDTVELRNGRYYFTGRRDGIINVGGFKVHPEEVEATINRHPEVAMSMVKAKKSPITGALVIADVVLKSSPNNTNGGRNVTIERDILRFCRGELDAHKVPTAINIVPMLTIGESGKLVRRNA
jgi:acyl-coenzyme A synthetase/AMP-(fatty) acid ligase